MVHAYVTHIDNLWGQISSLPPMFAAKRNENLMLSRFRQWYKNMQIPKNNPREFLKSGRRNSVKSLIVCAGDSLTHGQLSSNYIALLENRFQSENYAFVNAGINGDLTYNVLQRLDEIIECNPDVVTLLIGSNDINATYSIKLADLYRKQKKIPVTPSLEWSSANVEEIFKRLRDAGIKNVAVLSIPMLGENIDSELNYRVEQYNLKISELANNYGVSYLPLYERLAEQLPSVNKPPAYKGSKMPILIAAFRAFVLKQAWNTISDCNGTHFLTDHIHLNEKGANFIADLIEAYLKSTQH